MIQPLLDATREALMSLWRAMLLRRQPEPPPRARVARSVR